MTDNKLFTEFPPLTREQWEQFIQADLKGADYEKKLVWKTPEGFPVKPYYTEDDLTSLPFLSGMPGAFPWLRGNHMEGNPWLVQQDIWVDDPRQANEKALSLLENDVNSIRFCFSKDARGRFINETYFSILLQNIHTDCIALHFSVGNRAKDMLSLLKDHCLINQVDQQRITGTIDFNVLSHLAATGSFYESEKQDFASLVVAIQKARKHLPGMRILGIDGSIFRNGGSGIVQELAFSLSQANEYLAVLTEKGISVDDILKSFHFTFATGTSYFLEIAKLRAARLLLSRLAETWKAVEPQSSRMWIHSVTCDWNKTIYDPYVNVLRTTTEAMSAILGGTDSLTVNPFDASYKTPDEISERMARNIQLILRAEASLDRVADPAAGSYYIESLVQSVAAAAWDLFRKTETEGGFLVSMKEGKIQEQAEKFKNERLAAISTRRETILGTNQYPDFGESVSEKISEVSVFPKSHEGDHWCRPVLPTRGAQHFEQLRLKTEKQPHRPRVFMLSAGNLAMRVARANFSGNFFAAAGFGIIDKGGFETPEAGIRAAEESQADIVVICSSDEEYATIAPVVHNALAGKKLPNGKSPILVVAGAPACMEDLKARGISHFIHIRSNLLESLQQFQNELGY